MEEKIEEDCPDGMLGSYLYESFELLEQMEEIVLVNGSEGFFDRESINEIFRILHTLKGASGIMMYDNITSVAHKLEDIFYYLRESSAEDISKTELSDYIFQVSDFISGELHKIKEGKTPDGSPEKIEESIDAYLRTLKEEIQERGIELPPENKYIEPGQYYIAPAAEKMPIKIDLGEEPAPGDYVIGSADEKKDNIVGISVKKLEKLTILAEKLLRLEESMAEQQDTEKMCRKVHKVSSEILELVMEMRQAPVGGVFRKMNRVVFDASRKLSKDIELKMSGDDIMVDRMFLEQITAPLMHLVRNAADHGIENAGERLAAGKTARGMIVLDAVKQGDRLYISVKDDGRGLDKQKIFEKARKKRLVDTGADISCFSDAEIYQLITQAGFSTKEMVTELSGRGVGMDVVAGKMKEIGGNLNIASIQGKGTEMTMEIPLN